MFQCCTSRLFVFPNVHQLSCSFPAPECEITLVQLSFQEKWVGNFIIRICYSIIIGYQGNMEYRSKCPAE